MDDFPLETSIETWDVPATFDYRWVVGPRLNISKCLVYGIFCGWFIWALHRDKGISLHVFDHHGNARITV